MQDSPHHDDEGPSDVADDGGRDPHPAGRCELTARGQDGVPQHMVLVHESDAEHRDAIAPFVRDGLQRRERVMYVLHDNTRPEIESILESRGVDVDAATDAGALTFHEPADTYDTEDRTFDVDDMLSYVEQIAQEAVSDGRYRRLRITGEMTWVLDADDDTIDEVLEYETRLNALPEDLPWVGLCQYDRRRFPDAVLEDVIHAHPHQTYADTVEPNPTYVPPDDHPARSRSEDAGNDRGGAGTDAGNDRGGAGTDASSTASGVSGAHSSVDLDPAASGLVETAVDRVRTRRELSKRDGSLSELAAASSDIAYGDRDAVVERGVETIERTTTPAIVGFAGYDSDADELRVEATRRRPNVTPEDGDVPGAVSTVARSAFLTGEVRTRTGTDDDALDDALDGASVAACAAFPVDRHGVLFVADTTVDAFDEPDVELCRTVAHAMHIALESVAQERELERQRAEIDRLDDVNQTIREINRVLIEASTHEELQSLVCERLANVDSFAFAWIGARSPQSPRIVPQAWAGAPRGYLDAIYETSTNPRNQQDDQTQPATGDAGDERTQAGRQGGPREPTDDEASRPRTPARTALEDHTVCLVENAISSSEYERWRRVALDHGFRSVIAVPLVHNDTAYGVLSVGATDPNAFADVEREVLAELGSTVAYAIDATETKANLQADRVSEVGLRITDSGERLRRLASAFDGTLEVETILPAGEDALRLFFVASDRPSGDVVSSTEAYSFVESIREISDRDHGAFFEAIVHVDPEFPQSLDAYDATVVQLSVTETAVDLVVRLPDPTTVSEFVERIGDAYPEMDVTAIQRNRDRSPSTASFRGALESELTDRQLQALRVAYHNGYFAWPRDSSGEDVADAIGVSQPTFSRHIRVGHRKLLSLLFDDES